MISRPTTQQLLEDCAREVRETITPFVQDPAARVRLEMLEQILASCAVRSRPRDRVDGRRARGDAGVRRRGGRRPPGRRPRWPRPSPPTRPRRPRRSTSRTASAAYDRAGQAFCEAIDVALRSERADLAAKATTLVRARKDREADTRPGFFFPGRR